MPNNSEYNKQYYLKKRDEILLKHKEKRNAINPLTKKAMNIIGNIELMNEITRIQNIEKDMN